MKSGRMSFIKGRAEYLFSDKKYLFYLYGGSETKINFITCREFLSCRKNTKDKNLKNLFGITDIYSFLDCQNPLHGLFGSHTSPDCGTIYYNYFIGDDIYMDKNYVENFYRIISHRKFDYMWHYTEKETLINNIIADLKMRDRKNKIQSIIEDGGSDDIVADKIINSLKIEDRKDKIRSIL